MKSNILIATVAAVAGITVAPIAFAGVASGSIVSVAFSGPGGTGSDGGTGTTYTEPQFQFTSIDYIDLTITVSGAGSYDINEAPLFGYALNSTGQTWTGFTVTLLNGGVGTLTQDWADYPAGHSATYGGSPPTVTFSSENVPSGSSLAFTGDFTTNSAGTAVFRETPVSPTPEPSALALLGLAGMGLGLLRRRNHAVA